MTFQEHLQTCSDCRERYSQSQKPTVRIKGASSYRRERKLSELASIIKGVSYPGISYVGAKTKGAGFLPSKEKSQKLKELGKLVRG